MFDEPKHNPKPKIDYFKANQEKSHFIYSKGHDYNTFKYPANISEAEVHEVISKESNTHRASPNQNVD